MKLNFPFSLCVVTRGYEYLKLNFPFFFLCRDTRLGIYEA
jgi:hypothetical protein